MAKYTWKEKTDILAKNMCMEHLFDTLCLDKAQTFAIWVENNEVKSYDYSVLMARSFACAENIDKLSFGKEKGWTGIAVDTCREWPFIFWGLLASGRNVLLLDPSLDDSGIEHLMTQAGADSLVTVKKRTLPYAMLTPAELFGDKTEPSFKFVPHWADLIAACTSGTTATSRVYVYNGKALCLQIIGFSHHQDYPCLTCEETGSIRSVAFLPMNHIFGLLTNVITLPFQNSSQVFLKDRAPTTILETCRKAEAQMILTVPLLVNSMSLAIQKKVAAQPAIKRFMFHTMQKISLLCQRINPRWGLRVGKKLFKSVNASIFGDSMLQIVVGGARVPKEHMKFINSLGYAVTVGFGMTETAITAYENKIDLKSRLTGSVGTPLPISDFKIIPSGTNPQCGELLIKCDAMHIGRLSNGQMLPPSVDEDGWFHTGDIVRIDNSKRMWIEGRCKEVIIGESGENVYPDEIEETFTGMPNVEQLAVFGMSAGKSEQIAMLLNVGENFNNAPVLNDIALQIEKRNRTLRPLKRVVTVYVSPEPLPIVSSIKVKRASIRKSIEDGSLKCRVLDISAAHKNEVAKADTAPVEVPANDESRSDEKGYATIKNKIRECFAKELDIDISSIEDDASFNDDFYGDSLHRLGALMRIEEEFGVLIPEESYEYCTSINDLARVIKSLLDGTTMAHTAPDTVKRVTSFKQTEQYKEFTERFKAIDNVDNPYFVCHESPLKDTSIMNGVEVLNFGSYNYVGMSGRTETAEAAKAAIDKYGTSASGSRLLAGEKKLYQVLEKEIAEWKHAEDALVLVGGHSTNVTVVGHFCVKGDLIVYDALAHNSIHEGCRLSEAIAKPFPHNDLDALETILRNQRDHFSKVLIVVEGAYSMDGDIAPIPQIVELKKKYGCFLMVDEAHSACVIGKTGGGVDEYFGLEPKDIDIKMGTLSKGLGACGGYIAGPSEIIEYMRYNVPGFVFSVGISPALAAEVLEALRLLRNNPEIVESLQRNITTFVTEAKKRGLDTCLAGKTAIIPVLIGKDEDAFILSSKLSHMGVFVPPAVYPAVPKGQSRLRFCVTSDHKPEQIVKALDLLMEATKELGIDIIKN